MILIGHERMRLVNKFVFEHAGSTGLLAWLRYKAKESWILARAVFLLRETDTPSIVLHNSVASKYKISQDFVLRHASFLNYDGARLITTMGARGLSMIVVAFIALGLFILPLKAMMVVVQMFLARPSAKFERVAIFFDGHLSGFILSLALNRLGVSTATLQHGLYRCDDAGSRMALANFASDKVFLWDDNTRNEFIRFGVAPERLHVCGQYGFSHLFARRKFGQNDALVALCPPYNKDKIGFFIDLAATLAPSLEVRYSLHSIMRSAVPHSRCEPLAQMVPRPRVSVCGDSAVILDSLASGIPVISVGPRALAATHFFFEDKVPKESEWEVILCKAEAKYKNDLRTFGFDVD